MNSYMLDKHGKEIKEGDILKGSFRGQGGEWIAYAVVKHNTDRGFYLQMEGGNYGFSHAKFCSADRREIVDKLPDGWSVK